MAPFQIGQASIGGNDPQAGDVDIFGRPFTRATEDENARVRRILDVLQQTQQNVDPETGQPLIRMGVPEQSGQQPMPPQESRSQFNEILRTDPQRALEALRGLGQQMQGVPQQAQGQVMQQLGVTPPPIPTEAQMKAAAAGFQVPGVPREKAAQFLQQQQAEKMQEFEQKRQLTVESQLAPPGLFLDKEGLPYTPVTRGDIERGTTFYRQNSPQQKVFGATGIINSHVDQTLKSLDHIWQGDRNRFTQLLGTSLQRFTNDPEINNMLQFLGPATALAVATAYAAGGTNMRGGVRLAEMFQEGVYSPGDTLRTSLTKLRTLTEISLDNAVNLNLHPKVVAGIQERIKTIDKMMEPAGGSLVRMRLPNGREMWFPPENVDRAKERGAKVVK